ncbi:MAG: chemotaxis protein CheD [Spirochaetaceae bacterium]
MYRHFNSKFQSDVIIIHPGEYYATGEETIISTILGSCVAVALYDDNAKVGGLNHFMLPGSLEAHRGFNQESAKYGLYAMEVLINELFKLGGSKQRMVAKVFGGGHVLHASTAGNVPRSNVEFAMEFLKTEGIPISASDVGGIQARKLFFYPTTAKVLLKRITATTTVHEVEEEETEYLKKLREERNKKKRGEVTLF